MTILCLAVGGDAVENLQAYRPVRPSRSFRFSGSPADAQVTLWGFITKFQPIPNYNILLRLFIRNI